MSNIESEVFYKRIGRKPGDFSVERREQDVLLDKKWFLFLRRASVFRFIPFVRIVFGSGSMALGNVHQSSDFDVLISCKYGRIFTVRFLSIVLTALLGTRKDKYRNSNCLCLNHFITEKSYRLKEPYDTSWRELYKNLVPIYGKKDDIEIFMNENDWAGNIYYEHDMRHVYEKGSKLALYLEWLLSGKLGDFMEKIFKRVLLLKFYKFNGMPKTNRDRIVISDEEMELHLDARPRDEE